jgi:hypothetical protein
MSASAPPAASASHPHSLSGLTVREQISDCLIRACLALDAYDRPLWDSAWATSSPVSLVVNGRVMQGKEAVDHDCFDVAGPLDTQHLLSGVRIDVKEGAHTARLTCNALNQHFRPGEGLKTGAEHLMAGSVYEVEVVKEDSGEWRMKTWKLNLRWSQGSWAVMHP